MTVEDRPPRVQPVAVFHPLYRLERRPHESVCQSRPRVVRLRHVDAGCGAEPRLRAHAVVALSRVSRPARGLEPPAARRVSRQPRHRRLRRARHDGAGAASGRRRVPRDLGWRSRYAGRRRVAAGRARHAHAAPVGHGERRARPSFLQGRRGSAALPVGRLQPRLPARAAQLLRRLHRQRHRRRAARLSDGDAAGDQRQPAGAADDGGEPVRAGRLAGDHAAHRERGAALRVQQAAGGRRRPDGDLRPGVGDAAPRGAGRRAARGHRRGLEQPGPACWRQLAAARRRLVAAARRLRDLLRRQHAHRKLRALLQPAVLHVPGLRARWPGVADGGRSVSGGRGLRAPHFGEHAGAGISHGASPPGQPGHRDARARRGRVGALGRRARDVAGPQAQPESATARSRRRGRAPADSRLRRHPSGRSGG